MAVPPLPPPEQHPSATCLALDDFRDSEVTMSHSDQSPEHAARLADLATIASRVESLVSAASAAYDDFSTGRTSDLPRKSQRVTDILVVTRDEARKMLDLAYKVLSSSRRG
jgi:hypothetical protein